MGKPTSIDLLTHDGLLRGGILAAAAQPYDRRLSQVSVHCVPCNPCCCPDSHSRSTAETRLLYIFTVRCICGLGQLPAKRAYRLRTSRSCTHALWNAETSSRDPSCPSSSARAAETSTRGTWQTCRAEEGLPSRRKGKRNLDGW